MNGRFYKILFTAIALSSFLAGLQLARAAESSKETERAAAWTHLLCGGKTGENGAKADVSSPIDKCPLSFIYKGKSATDLLPAWKASRKEQRGEATTSETATWIDPATGLEVRIEAVRYKDFPAVEWVGYFKNTGTASTPILENIRPLEAGWRIDPAGKTPVLHSAKGGLCCIEDFAPVEKPLEPNTQIQLQPGGGRSSSENLPFFNIDLGGRGFVMAIGWTGEWKAEFERKQLESFEVRAGMARTHLHLQPGEEIRTPKILMLFWEGNDRFRGNNLLRRFLLAHHRPTPGGKPIVLPIVIGGWGGAPADEHLKKIDRIVRNDLPVELYWIDAEWFGKVPWHEYNGDWEVRKDLYPQGMKAISEPLHKSGRKFLLWFEPQRVCAGTPWAKFAERPNWLLELRDANPEYQQRGMDWKIPHEDPRWIVWESHRSQITEGDRLWNMGEPGARKFLTDWLSERIDEFGLDWYREDFNIAPLEYWNDATDRVGMTEIRFVEGLYAMWDELLARHPNLAIDNCASGGRRIDLESVGRATPLWRTDWPVDAIHKQCHTYGLLAWVPLNMSGPAAAKKGNEYEIRSAMTAGMQFELPRGEDENAVRETKEVIGRYADIRRFYYGDYYPLTPYSQSNDAWMAYQLALPESGEGLVVALKRPGSDKDRLTLTLHELNPDASYELVNLDDNSRQTVKGLSLMEDGLSVTLARKPDSALIRYRKVD